MAQFDGRTYQLMATVGDQMFQLTDASQDTSAPEPAPLTLVPAALLGFAFLRRKR